MTMHLRQKVLAEARTWIGTPFHHGAELKGVGVDCGFLILRVFADLGIVEPFRPAPYTPDWHLHRDEERYLDALLARSTEVSSPRLGDVALFRVGRCYSHGGIVTRPAPLTIVHASCPARIVLEEDVGSNAEMADPRRAVRFFDVIGRGAA